MTALQEAIASLRTDDLQWEAFNCPSPCVVLAPPGSGKTRLVTTRLAFDLLTRIREPHGAACITMTNSAADELRDRLARLGTKPRPNLFVGTVHAFALAAIVGPYAALAGRPDIAAATLADDRAQRGARAQAVLEILGPNQPPDAIDVVTTIGQRRKLMNYDQEAQELGGPRFAQLARRYEELLLADGHYDFDDLVRIAVDFVEQNGWLRRILAEVPHLYVDEYQDLAPGLDRLVQALCFDERANAELFAVGDPDQAIFGFSGTAPHLLQVLARRPSVTAVRLETNFRSHQNIIDTALRHLGQERTVRGKSSAAALKRPNAMVVSITNLLLLSSSSLTSEPEERRSTRSQCCSASTSHWTARLRCLPRVSQCSPAASADTGKRERRLSSKPWRLGRSSREMDGE